MTCAIWYDRFVRGAKRLGSHSGSVKDLRTTLPLPAPCLNAGSEAITSLIRGIRARRRACPTAPSPSVATPRIAGCTSSCDQIEAGISSCACRCVTDCRSNAPEFAPSGDQATSPRRESALCALAAGLLLVPHEDAYQCVRACEAVVGVVQK